MPSLQAPTTPRVTVQKTVVTTNPRASAACKAVVLSRPTVVAAAPPTPPDCALCSRATERFVTRQSNRKGNAGRPYYKCVPCGKFARFDDERGNDARNPPCDGCGRPSKRQVAGRDTKVPGGVHYVCSQGTCDFYQPHVNGDGVQLAVLDDELLKALVRLNLV